MQHTGQSNFFSGCGLPPCIFGKLFSEATFLVCLYLEPFKSYKAAKVSEWPKNCQKFNIFGHIWPLSLCTVLPPNNVKYAVLLLFLLSCSGYSFFLGFTPSWTDLAVYGLNDAFPPKDVPFGVLMHNPEPTIL